MPRSTLSTGCRANAFAAGSSVTCDRHGERPAYRSGDRSRSGHWFADSLSDCLEFSRRRSARNFLSTPAGFQQSSRHNFGSVWANWFPNQFAKPRSRKRSRSPLEVIEPRIHPMEPVFEARPDPASESLAEVAEVQAKTAPEAVAAIFATSVSEAIVPEAMVPESISDIPPSRTGQAIRAAFARKSSPGSGARSPNARSRKGSFVTRPEPGRCQEHRYRHRYQAGCCSSRSTDSAESEGRCCLVIADPSSGAFWTCHLCRRDRRWRFNRSFSQKTLARTIASGAAIVG